MSHPISHPILVTGAAGGQQGSTGRAITMLLLELRIPVRAFVHKLDARSDELRQQGAEIFEGDLLNPASVRIFNGRKSGPFIFRRHPTTRTCVLLSAAVWQSKTPRSCRGAMATPSSPSPALKT